MTKPAKNTKADEPEAPVMTTDEVREIEAVPADAEVTPYLKNEEGWDEDRAVVTPLVAADATRRQNVIDAFMAGAPTYGPAPAWDWEDPLDLSVPIFKDYYYHGTLANLQNDPVYGNAGSDEPDDFTAGQFVRIIDGLSFAHHASSLWVAGKAPAP